MPNHKQKVSNKLSQPKINWQNFLRAFVAYLLIALVGLFLIYNLGTSRSMSVPEITLSQAIQDIKGGKVGKVVVEGDVLKVNYKDGNQATTRKESAESLIRILENAGLDNPTGMVDVQVKSTDITTFWLNLFMNLLPVILIGVIFFFFIRQAQRTTGSLFSFGKSTARLFSREGTKITFSDAAGVDEAKQELSEVVDFLKNPTKYHKLGARIPKGVLLVGSVGTGKTLLARAVAGEANVPFYSIAGSEFMEMLVGVGASRVRDIFARAKASAPSILFIDEIESIGRHRGISIATHGEQEQTLNQILVEMDGFTPNDRVVILAATNRPDLLDPALTRPGRFDRRVVLELPDIDGRKEIIKIHQRGKPFAKEADVEKLARRTVGFSGADLANMLNEAAILAAREGKSQIDNLVLEEAATKVKLGPERKRMQSEEEKRLTAYHESGHAMVTSQLKHLDPVHRISIVARGLALGFTQIVPQADRYHQTKTRLLEQITSLLGGRVAEELIFNEMTVGAGNDLESASFLARKMVAEFGMSELGPVSFTSLHSEKDWTGRFLRERVEYSEAMAEKIDIEVKRIMDGCYGRARKILEEKEDKLKLVAEALIKKETLEQEEFETLIMD